MQDITNADDLDERIISIRLSVGEIRQMEFFIEKERLPDIETVIRVAIGTYLDNWPWTNKCRWLEVCREMGVKL